MWKSFIKSAMVYVVVIGWYDSVWIDFFVLEDERLKQEVEFRVELVFAK